MPLFPKEHSLNTAQLLEITKEFSDVDTLIKQKNLTKTQYEEICEKYNKLFQKYEAYFNDWEYRCHAVSAKKTKNFELMGTICEKGKAKFPNSSYVLSEYYWYIYFTAIKSNYFYSRNEFNNFENEVFPKAIEIRDKYKSNPKFSPFNLTVLAVGCYLAKEERYNEGKEWLDLVISDELQRSYKFKDEEDDQDIFFLPQIVKYLVWYVKCLFHTGDYEKSLEISIKALNEFPTLYGIQILLPEILSKKYGMTGRNLINELLANIGFADDKIRDNYANAILFGNYSILLNWENNRIEEHEMNTIAKALKNIITEIKCKKQNWKIIFNEEDKVIRASEISDFSFCPIAFAISKSVEISDFEKSAIEYTDEKKSLYDRLKIYDETKSIDVAFSEIGTIPTTDLMNSIFAATLIHSKYLPNPTSFTNKVEGISGLPDYLFSSNSNEKFIVEEKFHFLMKGSKKFDAPFLNHEMETLSNISKTGTNVSFGIIIYWYWNIERPENNILKLFNATMKISGYSTYKIDNLPQKQNELNNFILQIRKLNESKISEFDTFKLNPNKCANCGVSNYCFHKTGRLNDFSIPYLKIDLEKIPPKIYEITKNDEAKENIVKDSDDLPF